MTRERWYRRRSYWRKAIRSWREKYRPPVHFANNANLMKALKELYDFYLEPKEQATLDMIRRYENRVSSRLKLLMEELIKKGNSEENKQKGLYLFRNLVYDKNPWLELIPKETGFFGKYVQVPIEYKE